MIFQKTFHKIIPSYRHKKISIIKDLTNFYKINKNHNFNNNLTQKKKHIYKNIHQVSISNKIFKFINMVTVQTFYNTKPFKKFFICKTSYNFYKIIPAIEKLNVGQPIFSFNYIVLNPYRLYYRGVLVELHKIPLTAFITNISNQLNTKITFAKASGSFCKTQKSKKSKQKLILIILPSKKHIHLPKYAVGYIGKTENFRTNKLIEGKWGFSFYKKKHISVRGVAMNPVDHPNGGRTKTVQPERSPWNWVAKNKK